MIGETLSHYRILERLGAGGMGEVYKAEDTRLQRFVAVKLMLEGATGDQTRARFVREARAASAINHPNIATIFEIDEVEHQGKQCSFIVMEFVQGRMLKDLAGTLSLSESLDIIEQMADGLATAHEHGVVHRDIKPSNILVTEQQFVKILDFGVAKFTPRIAEDDETSSLFATEVMKTTPGTVIGTYSYMSPEQARGLDVDHRSDIFSLGVVAYELIAGRQPFQGSSALAVVDSILHVEPVSLASYNSQILPDFERVIRRMLEKNRDLRYQTLRDAIGDLDLAKRGMTNLIAAPSYDTNVGYDTQLLNSGSRDAATHSMRSRAGKSVAVLSFNNVTQREEDAWLGVGIAETVTADLKNIGGIVVIGRERIYEALRHWHEDLRAEFDEKMATRIGQEVGARWIIGGGYQRLGDMLRITARAVEVQTGEIVKTVKIDGRMDDVFALQDKIVIELSRDLDLTLNSGHLGVMQQPETLVIEAYEAYSKGQDLAYSGTREGIDEAIRLTERAIELDPNYARAYAGLAYSLTIKGQYEGNMALAERAVEYAQKAVELRPNMADAYSILGFIFTALDRPDDSIGALKRALAFAPNDSFVRSGLGRAYFIGKGMFKEAAAEYELALLNPGENNWIAASLAHILMYTGNYERAEKISRQAIKAQEGYAINHEGIQIIGSYLRLGQALFLQGRYEEALAEFDREKAFLESSNHGLKDRTMIELHQKYVSTLVRLGRAEEARKAYVEVLTRFQNRMAIGADEPFSRYYVACAAAVMGDVDLALEHLKKAIEGRPVFNRARARIEPDLESLRNDPQFQALLNS